MTIVEKETGNEKGNDNETEKQTIFKLPIEYIENKTKVEQHFLNLKSSRSQRYITRP